MKKLISVLLALIMIFSVTTVAFAADTDDTTPPASEGTTTEDSTEGSEEAEGEEDSLLGEYDWILDLPFATVKPALKIAKIALKFYKVYLKLGLIFGWVGKEEFTKQVSDIINSLIGDINISDIIPDMTTTAPAADAA